MSSVHDRKSYACNVVTLNATSVGVGSLKHTVSAPARIEPADPLSHLPLHAVDNDALFHRQKHQPLDVR